MQDNNLHIDNDFIDKAWQDMKAILDVEMPTKKKNRRFLIWWYAGGVALAASLIGFWLNASQPVPAPIQTMDSTSVEMAANNQNQDNSTLLPASETPPNNNETSTQTNPTLQPNNVQTPPPLHATSNKGNTKIAYLAGPIIESKTITTDQEEPTIPTPAEEIVVHRADAPTLLPQPSIASFSLDDATLTGPPIDIHFKREIQLVTEGALTLASNQNLSGYDFGFLVKMPLGQNRFSIETGIRYSHFNQPLTYLIETQQDDTSMEIFEAVTDVAYSSNEFNLSPSSIPFFNSRTEQNEKLTLQYLQIPVALNYQYKRFRFSTGLQAGLLLTTSGSQLVGGLFNARSADIALGAPSNSNDPQFNSSINTLSNFDLAATGGLGYDLTHHLGFGLVYHHGFTDVIKSNTKKDQNNLIRFAVRYTW